MSVCNVGLGIDPEQTQVLRSHLRGGWVSLFRRVSVFTFSFLLFVPHYYIHYKLAFCYPVFIEHLLILTYYRIYLVSLYLLPACVCVSSIKQ